ncbi:hypothetical protein QTP70_003751 [Hemibagrus guttatus]|uniref:Cadherin-20 n=1 Tax=Hemibagrus guttatus TaxID=175788 RepID=A0AAE0QQK0_9TELE|nr:hypothetical protein QTP70_003751 [Hemibagrus guttatus]
MVVCRMTLMVCKTKRSKIEKKTKWWKLKKEECCEEFRQKLRQALGGQVVLPDDWETTAEVIRETGRKVLGVSSGRRKEDKETWWWNEEVQDSIQRKRLAKKKWDMDRTEENRQEYKELQRRVKREVSKAKQKAYEELYTRLDTREGEKDLYRLARQRDRDGKDVQQVRVIKDRDGRVLTSEESVQRRWKEYFEELMNEENEREKRVEGVNSVEQKVDKIRKDEVRKALKRMKSGKAVGPDDIPVEVWKCLGEAAVEFLANLFNRVLESERMPEEWRRSVLVPIFKNKGDVQSCSNYRGIKLMSHTMKYRDGQKELHCVFVDLEKAYDRVPREELWYCMRKSGVAEKYVRVVQDMYERSRTVVRCAVGQTEEFNVEVGLHQGSALSPFLFAMVMDQLSEEVRQESPWTMMFADDIVICSESREQVEENLERWRFALERRGMKVSRSKTEYMCVNEREGSGTVRLQGEEVKKVQEFKYLGSTVQSNGECGKEVKKRVQAGWNGWRKVSGVLCDQKISARIKGKVYRTVVRAAMLYGLETVSLRKRQESELELHSDLDKGDGSVKYILSGEGAGTTFTLDDSTGDIHAVQRLDREMKEQYILRAQATHRHTGRALEPESHFIVKIQDINDNEPKFLEGPYQATVPEMSAVGTPVIRVTATDADDPSYGEVRVSLPDMDREVKGQYEVVIQAKDMAGQLGGLVGMTTVNITLSDVNDNPPHFPQKLYQISIPESAPIGSVVGHIEAQDHDLGINAEICYRVVDGDGQDVFDISTNSNSTYGVITVKQRLNFETKRIHILKVEAANTHTDKRFSANGPYSDITTVQVSIEDVDEPPQFSATLYYAEVREDAKIGTVLITISARDPDAANSSVRYMIDHVSDPDQYFSVGMSSGSVTTVLPLDREEISWHNLTVVAMETNNPLKTASVSLTIRVLDVNDNPPSISHYHEVFLCASARAGQLVQSIIAKDADEPIGGQRFRYTLSPEAQKNPNFTLIDNHDNSARVLTRRSGWVSMSVYHLPITVSDGGEPMQYSTHTLTIRVLMLVLMLFLSCSSSKKPFPHDDDENVRENIVHYDDEGGGEEDTVAFDITKLWKTHTEPLSYAELVFNGNKPDVKPNNVKLRQEKQPEIQSLSCYMSQTDTKYSTHANSNVYSYMLAKLCEVDLDEEAPPYDSVQTYAYEGEGKEQQIRLAKDNVSHN